MEKEEIVLHAYPNTGHDIKYTKSMVLDEIDFWLRGEKFKEHFKDCEYDLIREAIYLFMFHGYFGWWDWVCVNTMLNDMDRMNDEWEENKADIMEWYTTLVLMNLE